MSVHQPGGAGGGSQTVQRVTGTLTSADLILLGSVGWHTIELVPVAAGEVAVGVAASFSFLPVTTPYVVDPGNALCFAAGDQGWNTWFNIVMTGLLDQTEKVNLNGPSSSGPLGPDTMPQWAGKGGGHLTVALSNDPGGSPDITGGDGELFYDITYVVLGGL